MTRMASDVIEVQVSFIHSGTARQGTLDNSFTVIVMYQLSPELPYSYYFSFPYQELSSRLLVSNCGKIGIGSKRTRIFHVCH